MTKAKKEEITSIACIFCSKNIEFPKYIVESSKYNGQIACQECGTLLHIKRINTEIQEYRIVEKNFRPNEEGKKWLERLADKMTQAKSNLT